MVEVTHLGTQPSDATLCQPADAGDSLSDHSVPPQPDPDDHRTTDADIIMALQARMAKLEKRAQLQDQALFVEQAEIRRSRAVQLAEDISPATTIPLTIVVRKIRDHTVDDADLEFLASSQTTLERNGDLDMTKLGFVKASDSFSIRAPGGSMGNPSWEKPFIIDAGWIEDHVSYEDDVHPFLNIIELKDYLVAFKRNEERWRARKIAERNAFLKGLVRRPFSWMTSLALHLSTCCEKSSDQRSGSEGGADGASLGSKVSVSEPAPLMPTHSSGSNSLVEKSAR